MNTYKPNDVRVSRELFRSALGAVEYLALRGDDIGTSNVPVANALRALLAQPADQQGEPDIVIDLVQPNPYSDGLHIRIWHNTGMLGPGEYKLYLHVQPATAKVVLPERRPICCHEDAGFNECLDEVAKLNGGQT